MKVFSDHDDGHRIILSIKAGREASAFANFILSASEALKDGRIPPKHNPGSGATPEGAAQEIASIARLILKRNG
jgi:hypothetical protein